MVFNNAGELWTGFRGSICTHLKNTPTEEFWNIWHNVGRRTDFYISHLLPRVASDLQLKTVFELFKVDMAMGRQSSTGAVVPLVWIESENNSSTAQDEVRKLVCLSGPLKVLITCDEWDSTPGAWPHGGKKTKLLQSWTAILNSHYQIWHNPSVFAILVGEWNGPRSTLRFYATVFDAMGERIERIENDSILLDRNISVRN